MGDEPPKAPIKLTRGLHPPDYPVQLADHTKQELFIVTIAVPIQEREVLPQSYTI